MELVRDKVITEKKINSSLSEMFREGQLRKDHPQQRRAGQWDNAYTDGFIASVIKNEDFDSIKICEQLGENGVTLWLIDGIQRLSTIDRFRSGEYRLGKNIEFPTVKYQTSVKDETGKIVKDEDGNPTYEVREFDLRGKCYEDLPKELKDRFENCEISVVKHLDCTDEEVAYHIRRYNHSKPMNGNQISVTYADWLAGEIKNVSSNRFFIDCGHYSAKEKTNGTLERIVMESVMAMFHLDNWQKVAKNMGKYIKENSSKEEFNILDNELTELADALDDKFADLFNKKDSFAWISSYHYFKNAYPNCNTEDFGKFLSAFRENLHCKKINGVTWDEIDENRRTKDKTLVTQKITFIQELMRDYFGEACPASEETITPEVEIIEEKVENPTFSKADINFIAKNVELDRKEVEENMTLYTDSLDDYMDRAMPEDSSLREDDYRLPLLGVVAYTYKNDIDPEPWFKDIAATGNFKGRSFAARYVKMIGSLEDYETQKFYKENQTA